MLSSTCSSAALWSSSKQWFSVKNAWLWKFLSFPWMLEFHGSLILGNPKFCFISFIWFQKLTCNIEWKHGLLQLLLSESSCVVLNYLSSTLILKLSPVVNAVILNQTKEIWRDFTRFAIISKPNIQITQNKNPVEANYIAYHIIVNFFKTGIQLSQKKYSFEWCTFIDTRCIAQYRKWPDFCLKTVFKFVQMPNSRRSLPCFKIGQLLRKFPPHQEIVLKIWNY